MSRRPGATTSKLALGANLVRGVLKGISRPNKYTSISMSNRLGGTEMATIQLRTQVPGPKSQELMRRRNAAVPRGVYHSTPIFVARAEGIVLYVVASRRNV